MTKKKYKKYFDSFLSLVKRQKKNLIISCLIAIAINIFCYWLGNYPYPDFDSLAKVCFCEYFIESSFERQSKIDDSDIYFLDVAYDKQIAKYSNPEYGINNGKVAVTDRHKLLTFLKAAEKSNTYKYIFLDIRFEKGIEALGDSALFNQINRMRDIEYANHYGLDSKNALLKNKSAINDYYTTILNTNLTRYQFLQNGKESAAIKMFMKYNDINESPIKKHGFIYTWDGSLCQNSPFLIIDRDFYSEYIATGKDNYANLGDDWFLKYKQPVIEATGDSIPLTPKNVGQAIKNRIVIVGDFISDTQDTYFGPQPGPYIIYLAFKSLQSGKQKLSLLFMFFMTAIYITISLFILNHKSIWQYIPWTRRISNNFILFLLSFTGYGTVLLLISILLYLLFRTTYNVFFTTLLFSLLSRIMSSNNYGNK